MLLIDDNCTPHNVLKMELEKENIKDTVSTASIRAESARDVGEKKICLKYTSDRRGSDCRKQDWGRTDASLSFTDSSQR